MIRLGPSSQLWSVPCRTENRHVKSFRSCSSLIFKTNNNFEGVVLNDTILTVDQMSSEQSSHLFKCNSDTNPMSDTNSDDRLGASVTFLGSWDSSGERGSQLRQKFEDHGLEVTDLTVMAWPRVVFAGEQRRRQSLLGIIRAHRRNILALFPFLFSRERNRIVVCGFKVSYELVLLKLFRRWSRAFIIYDPYISLVDTLVDDRKIISNGSLVHWALGIAEKLTLRCADLVVADTEESADLFAFAAGRDLDTVVLPVYVKSDFISNHREPKPSGAVTRVLYFGNYVPLHGLGKVVRAIALLESPARFNFCFVGDGQERYCVEQEASKLGVDIRFIDRMAVWSLVELIDEHDVCLGVFGSSEKAKRVVPNKVFLALARGVPVLTLDSAPVRRYVGDGVLFVSQPDETTISAALEQLPAKLASGVSLVSPDVLSGSRDRRFDARIEGFLAKCAASTS